MKLFVVFIALAAAVSAAHKHESVPILKKACVCPPVNCPSALMNAKSVCECQNAAALACYTKSERGCPEPQPKGC